MTDLAPPEDDRHLDGCDVDMAVEDQITEDGEQTDALVMFADCWDDSDAVEVRRRELVAWDAATQNAADDTPTTGAPDA